MLASLLINAFSNPGRLFLKNAARRRVIFRPKATARLRETASVDEKDKGGISGQFMDMVWGLPIMEKAWIYKISSSVSSPALTPPLKTLSVCFHLANSMKGVRPFFTSSKNFWSALGPIQVSFILSWKK